MKFDKIKYPKVVWTLETIQQQIDKKWSEIKEFNKKLNAIDGQISALKHEKERFARKIGDKRIYINQLEKQMVEAIKSQ